MNTNFLLRVLCALCGSIFAAESHAQPKQSLIIFKDGSSIQGKVKRPTTLMVDPASGKQVYPGFAPPTNLFPDNSGKIAQRIRPRYNSEHVWNSDFDNLTNLIDVHIRALRRKLDDTHQTKLLHTIRGVGYRLGVTTT